MRGREGELGRDGGAGGVEGYGRRGADAPEPAVATAAAGGGGGGRRRRRRFAGGPDRVVGRPRCGPLLYTLFLSSRSCSRAARAEGGARTKSGSLRRLPKVGGTHARVARTAPVYFPCRHTTRHWRPAATAGRGRQSPLPAPHAPSRQRLLPTPKQVTGTTPPRASTLATAAAVLLEHPRLSPSPPPSTTKLHAQPTKHKTPVDHTTGQPVRAEVDQTRPPKKSIPNTTVRDRSSRRNNKTVSTRCEQGYRRRSGSSNTSRGAREPRARQRDAPTISLERYQHDSGPGTEPDTPSSAGNSLLYK